jgi:hypothetical protein
MVIFPLHSACLYNLPTLGLICAWRMSRSGAYRYALLFEVDFEVDRGVAVIAWPTGFSDVDSGEIWPEAQNDRLRHGHRRHRQSMTATTKQCRGRW